MSGVGAAPVSSLIHEAWSLVVSLPDLILYGGATVLGVLLLSGLYSAIASPSAGTTRVSATGTVPTSSGQSSPSDTEPTSADESSSRPANAKETSAETSPADETASSNGSPSDNEPRPAIRDPVSQTPARTLSQKQSVPSDTLNQGTREESSTLGGARIGRTKETTFNRSGRKSRLHRPVGSRMSTRRRLRRHLVDGVDVNTGFDWMSTDYTWSVAELDLGVNGVSVDASGELIYIDPIPSLASYDLVDSPIKISSPSLLRLVLGRESSQSNAESQGSEAKETQKRRRHWKEDSVSELRQQSLHRVTQSESSPTHGHSRVIGNDDKRDWRFDTSRANSWYSRSQFEASHSEQRTDEIRSIDPAGSDGFVNEQSVVAESNPTAREYESPYDDHHSIGGYAESVSQRLEEEVTRVEEEIREQQQNLEDGLWTGRDSGYQPQVEMPHLQLPDLNENAGPNCSLGDATDSDIDPERPFGGGDYDIGPSENFGQTWEDNEQWDNTFVEEDHLGFREPVFNPSQTAVSFGVDDGDLGAEAHLESMFPEIGERAIDDEWTDSESGFGSWW